MLLNYYYIKLLNWNINLISQNILGQRGVAYKKFVNPWYSAIRDTYHSWLQVLNLWASFPFSSIQFVSVYQALSEASRGNIWSKAQTDCCKHQNIQSHTLWLWLERCWCLPVRTGLYWKGWGLPCVWSLYVWLWQCLLRASGLQTASWSEMMQVANTPTWCAGYFPATCSISEQTRGLVAFTTWVKSENEIILILHEMFIN